jgi:small subunit ribosomal protein S6
MMRDYELMYIIRPELDDDAVRATVKTVRTFIESQGGEVVKTTLWGKRRLAYEVQRLRDGHYVLAVLRLDGERVRGVERALRLNDNVFRHLVVLHEGPMPEPDGEIEEARLEPTPEAAPPEVIVAGENGENVDAPSALSTEDAVDDEELAAAPSASDEDEGDL